MKKKLICVLLLSFVLLTSCEKEEKQFVVNFDVNGGTPSIKSQTIKKGDKAKIPNEPSRENYIFVGWGLNKNSKDLWLFNTNTINSDITLYAIWDYKKDQTVTEQDWNINIEQYKIEAENRRQHIFTYITSNLSVNTSPKQGFPIASALFKMYEQTGDDTYLDQAINHTKTVYNKFKTEYVDRGIGDCFASFYGIYLYGLYNKYFTQELLELAYYAHTNDNYTVAPHTPNHALQSAVARFLAGEFFPDTVLSDFYGQDNRDYEDKTGEQMIRRILENYPVEGLPEPNSDSYMFCHYGPIMAISRLAQSIELQNEATMVNENIIFTSASTWLEGMISVGMDRNYQPYVSQNEGGVFTLYLWYLFGGNDINGNPIYPNNFQMKDSEANLLGFVLADDYLPNEIALMMAWDRSNQYLHEEMHTYYKDRINWEMRFIFTFQTYMDQFYSVFTSKLFITKPEDFYRYTKGLDQYIFGVNWIGSNPNEKSSFTIAHWDDLVTDNHTKIGATIYSQVFQNDRTVIGVFDIPIDQKEYPDYIVINQPNNYVAIINESLYGRVWLHYGNVMIAYQLSKSFLFNKDDFHINVPMNKGYFAVEVVRADEYDGTPEEQLEKFYAQTVTNFKNIQFDFKGKTEIKSYKSLTGDILSMRYDGSNPNGAVNGVEVEYGLEITPLQSNLWVHQLYGDKVIIYKYKGKYIKFDFVNMIVTKGNTIDLE